MAAIKQQKLLIVGPTKDKSSGFDDTYIWSLQHPRYPGLSVKYMIKSGEIMELQKVEPMRRSSFFIGQYVQSDGVVYVASRIDPCFLLLSILKQGARKYSPLAQILTTAASDLRSLVDGCSLGLERLCDVKDLDEDGMFYRINDDKVLQWLKNKVSRVADKLCQLEQKEVTKRGTNGFAEGFSLGGGITNQNIDTELKVTGYHMSCGLEIVCEYLDEESADTLRLAYADRSDMQTTKTTDKRPITETDQGKKWGASDVDEMSALAFGQPKKAKTDGSSSRIVTQTVKNKSLGKVPPKGMKSMASYFTKKA